MLVKKVVLQPWGDSQGIQIEMDVLKELGVARENLVFVMTVEKGKIVLIPQKEHPKTLDELFEGYEGDFFPNEDHYDWGDPVGEELL